MVSYSTEQTTITASYPPSLYRGCISNNPRSPHPGCGFGPAKSFSTVVISYIWPVSSQTIDQMIFYTAVVTSPRQCCYIVWCDVMLVSLINFTQFYTCKTTSNLIFNMIIRIFIKLYTQVVYTMYTIIANNFIKNLTF